jgi:hypothetical protein
MKLENVLRYVGSMITIIIEKKSGKLHVAYPEFDFITEYTIKSINDMIRNRSKCLLYVKNESSLVRTIAKFMIEHDIGKYQEITVDNLFDETMFRCIDYKGELDYFTYHRKYNREY